MWREQWSNGGSPKGGGPEQAAERRKHKAFQGRGSWLEEERRSVGHGYLTTRSLSCLAPGPGPGE